MKWNEQHEAFKRFAIQHGISKLDEFVQALPFGYGEVSPSRLDRWFKQMLRVPTNFCGQRRYINRFKLGADPEFIFQQNGERMDARGFELAQGLAYGMDNNGRLTEIRPWPSRSALEVVASICSALRWLAILNPQVCTCQWVSGVYLHGDGLGGHVHFGRKRPGRVDEIKALDCVQDELLTLGVYNIHDILKRRNGDSHNQHYGLPGDFRKQIHGYEYRTFPSWLDSPELAFLILTLSKLVVHNPKLVQGFSALPNFERYCQRTRNILAYYKDVDDDARLALMMLMKKMPIHIGGDFKPRWGLGPVNNIPVITALPSCIEPSEQDIAEMFAHLSGKYPLQMRVPEPTWKYTNPPNGYSMLIKTCNTYGAKGLGEMVWDVVQWDGAKLKVVNTKDGDAHRYFSIPEGLAKLLPKGWKNMTNHKVSVHNDNAAIYSNAMAREIEHFQDAKRILTETVFPFWRISDVKPDSYQVWKLHLAGKPAVRKFEGEILYGNVEDLPLKELF